MRRIAIALSVTFVTAVSAYAQTTPGVATLEVEGTGTVRAVPDTVIIDIGVSTRGATPTEALANNNVDMQRVIDAVIAAGVPTTSVATSAFSISPVYEGQEQSTRTVPVAPGYYGNVNVAAAIVGYEVSNQVTVRIAGVEASGAVLDGVVAAGANRINRIRFQIADPQALQDQARAAAIAEARRQADLMADAADLTLVRIIHVDTYGYEGGVADIAMPAAVANTPIMGGEQTVSVRIGLTFEIAPR